MLCCFTRVLWVRENIPVVVLFIYFFPLVVGGWHQIFARSKNSNLLRPSVLVCVKIGCNYYVQERCDSDFLGSCYYIILYMLHIGRGRERIILARARTQYRVQRFEKIWDFYRCSINRFPLRTRLFLLIRVLSPIVIKRWRRTRVARRGLSACAYSRRHRTAVQSPPRWSRRHIAVVRRLPTPF